MTAPSPQAEVERAQTRRRQLGIQRPATCEASTDNPSPQPRDSDDEAQWALALSGGGIRSATFSLGVLQAMARTENPGRPSGWPLLAQFDYLSTVSGGGYIGGFFSSLFVPGRLAGNEREDEALALRRGFEALKDDPPARIHRDTNHDPERPGRAALAWLRDNGRYMAPSGSGDMLYAATIAVRNWFATQYVIATLILLALAGVQAVRWALASGWPTWRLLEQRWLLDARQSEALLWWSPSWAAPGVLLLLTAVPLGIAYWFSHPVSGGPGVRRLVGWLNGKSFQVGGRRKPVDPRDTLSAPPRPWTLASLLGLVIALVLLGSGLISLELLKRPSVALALFGASLSTTLAVVWYRVAARRTNADGQGSITRLRVLLTRWLSESLKWTLILATLAAIETLAQTLWLWVSLREGALWSTALAGIVWLLKEAAARLPDHPRGGWLSRVPVGLLAGLLGGLLWLSVAASLNILLLQVAWPEGWADPKVLGNRELSLDALGYACAAAVLATFLAWVVSRFPGFLNLSTLQSLYSARITRAYLGATNSERFRPEASAEARDVAEPILGDSLPPEAIHRNSLAPVHFVNVCVNQSVSPGEQLIQRDRKGKPLVIAPHGFYFDNVSYRFGEHGQGELAQPLAFGEWLGVSGAAFSTGLGRGTGLGMSLAMGFANVRLGRWWAGLPAQPGQKLPWRYRAFPTQAYLLDELTGTFYGDHRPYLYLSDGGHFENTAVFELLRQDRCRNVRVIVVTDCGCDPDYRFDDLANLIRLVRIDHGLEIDVNTSVTEGTSPLKAVFAHPDDFRRRPDGSLPDLGQRCAVLLDVRHTERSATPEQPIGSLHARIILIKPRLIDDAPVDVKQYQQTHPTFPQETTMDQFFDEAQWESYRQLGLRIGRLVFEGPGTPGHVASLWKAVLCDLPQA